MGDGNIEQRFYAPMLSAAADRVPHGAIIMSDPTSTRKVAAVTGGMGGIGQGIVIALTQRDFDVVVCDRKIDPAIAKSMTANVTPGARLSFIKMISPIGLIFPDSSMKCSPLAAGELPFATGAAIQVDGGMHIHQY